MVNIRELFICRMFAIDKISDILLISSLLKLIRIDFQLEKGEKTIKSTETYLLFGQKIFVDEFRVNGAHCDGFECERTTAVEVVFNLGRHNLHDILDSNTKLTRFIVARLWNK